MLVRYKGRKHGMHVTLPVGVNSKTAIYKTVFLAREGELPDADALLLVKLDPHNFELASDEIQGGDTKVEIESEVEIDEDGTEIHAPKKGRGRPKKQHAGELGA